VSGAPFGAAPAPIERKEVQTMALEPTTDTQTVLTCAESPAGAIIAFISASSAASQKARPELERFAADHRASTTFMIDVDEVKDLHGRFGVAAVPTVLLVRDGRVLQKILGPQTAAFYERALLGAAARSDRARTEKPAHRVVVYTTLSCVWCTRVKAYLSQKGVSYREVDVARDQEAARKMSARSGQHGVPQLDIDGRMVVGFDRARIDTLLGLGVRAGAA
jgi:glutaredoxin-like YruB-family protein